MRQRVLEAARAVGYIPDGVARSLRRGSTSTVGCVLAKVAYPLFVEILAGAGKALQSHGYTMLIANFVDQVDSEGAQLDMLRRHRVDGLLLSVNDESSPEMQAQLTSVTQPVVVLDRDLPGLEQFGRVLFDHRSAMFDAVATLAQLGHRHIAFVGGEPNIRPTRERSEAFLQACGELSISGVSRSGAHSPTHGDAATLALLAQSVPPTAIIAGGNPVLIGVLRAIRSLGLVVPRDLSVIACGCVPMMDALSPQLAVISRDLQLLGYESAEMLFSMLAGAPPETKTLAVTFRFGPSCAPPKKTGAHGHN
jgi:LacI family transcriptional regulator